MASGNDVPTEAGEQAWRQIGQQLREARLARDEDIRSIATYLRIRCEYLAALESGDMVALPGSALCLRFPAELCRPPWAGRRCRGRPAEGSAPIGQPGHHECLGRGRMDRSLRASMLAIAALLLAGTLLIGHSAVEPTLAGSRR